MTRAEESALIFKIMEGDKDLFRQLVDAHSGMIYSVLYRVTGSREDAEDLAQETFVKAYFSLGKYRGESSISTWLYSIAWHLAVSSLRKRKWTVSRERFTERELQESSAWLESGEDREMKVMRERQYGAIERAVAALEPQDRFLISAFYEAVPDQRILRGGPQHRRARADHRHDSGQCQGTALPLPQQAGTDTENR